MHPFSPAYLNKFHSGDLRCISDWAYEQLQDCMLCPCQCHVNRSVSKTGQYRSTTQARVYTYMALHGEENPLHGNHGSIQTGFSRPRIP